MKALTLILCALAACVWIYAFGVAYDAATRPAVSHCAEDDPCWNCATMGNRKCGPS